MKVFVRFSLCLLLLSGCSTMVNRTTQEMTIETPGAPGALCYLKSPGYYDRIWTPDTLTIQKTKGPLKIRCMAPGNMEKTVEITPKIVDTMYLNALTGYAAGALYDYETGAMFKYPEKVVIDFTDTIPQRMPEPDYQALLDRDPDLGGMEEFRPGKAALQRDSNRAVQPLHSRQSQGSIFSSPAAQTSTAAANEEALPSSSIAPEALDPSSSGSDQGASVSGTIGQIMNPQSSYSRTEDLLRAPVSGFAGGHANIEEGGSQGSTPVPLYTAQ